ncbi:hypothetical protein ATCC90586_002831 [Pythium insidiosum]|nr:hypothetical protein ATCC90586_002831 [Pythium insidiosum]
MRRFAGAYELRDGDPAYRDRVALDDARKNVRYAYIRGWLVQQEQEEENEFEVEGEINTAPTWNVRKGYLAAEGANQVEVLLLLYKARETVLNMNAPVTHYLHTKENPKIIKATELTPLVRKTRELLCEAFHQNFFKRYTDTDEISTCSYLFEMARFLYPRYKAFESKIGPLVRLCNVQRAVASPHAVARDVEVAIRDRVKDALRRLSPDDAPKRPTAQVLLEFSGDLALYEEEREAAQSPQQQHDALIDEELRRWKNDTTTLQESSPGSQRAESVLSYWRRNASRYQLLSKLARMVYAVPPSSAQIERDFGQSHCHRPQELHLCSEP